MDKVVVLLRKHDSQGKGGKAVEFKAGKQGGEDLMEKER